MKHTGLKSRKRAIISNILVSQNSKNAAKLQTKPSSNPPSLTNTQLFAQTHQPLVPTPKRSPDTMNGNAQPLVPAVPGVIAVPGVSAPARDSSLSASPSKSPSPPGHPTSVDRGISAASDGVVEEAVSDETEKENVDPITRLHARLASGIAAVLCSAQGTFIAPPLRSLFPSHTKTLLKARFRK